MVLIYVFFSTLFCTVDTIPSQYEKLINKTIKKSFDIETFDLETVEHRFGFLNKVYSQNDLMGYIYVAEVAACNLGGCSSFEKVNDQKSSEYFDVLVLLNADKEITTLKILDYFSDYGYEITSKKYLKKFEGKNVCLFSVEEDGIDAISGATISSYALEGSLDLLCRKLEEY